MTLKATSVQQTQRGSSRPLPFVVLG